MHLSLRFLGPFEAQLDDETKIESRAKKIEALLAFLATEADRAHRRERLVGLLFPEMPDEQARTNLRQTLTRLRRAINDAQAQPPFLLISRESTQFNEQSDHSLDITRFEYLVAGCEAHRLERDDKCENCLDMLAEAVRLYRGPFLDGFTLEDSAAFESWLLAKQERYQVEVLTALQLLADTYERRGAYAAAQEMVGRQLRIEPWKEEAHRQYMRLLAYQGERATALQHYKDLEDLLQKELGVKPLAATSALRDQIRSAEEIRPFQLPPRNTLFVGRSNELERIEAYLAHPDRRLVTITGPGGSGKTAIANETGWRIGDRYIGPFMHGVFFAPLAGISSGKQSGSSESDFDPLITALAEACKFSFAGPGKPRQQILRYLHDKSLLLILDNAEQIISEVRSLLGDILLHAPDVKVLVTSRERLGLSDEWVMEIEGLPYPAADVSQRPGSREWLVPERLAMQYQAIALFENLGKRLVSGFSLNYEDGSSENGDCPVSAVKRIVQMVQGLPLGIQLAAGWIRTLSCLEIAEEIEKNLDFLSSTMHDIPSRHQSLRAVFDSSWQLLNPVEQAALRRLAVFVGPFDRAAATAVTGASMITINALVDHSLLQRQTAPGPDQTRRTYELLEVLRQFAAERLEQDPDEAQRIRQQHTAYYLRFLSEQHSVLTSSRQRAAVEEITQNIKEIRSAWRWAVDHRENRYLPEAMETLSLFYYMRSWFAEGVELFGLATRELHASVQDKDDQILWAKLRARQGWFTFLLGSQQEGCDYLLESITILREVGEQADLPYSLSFTAAALAVIGDYQQAIALARESLRINEQLHDDYGCAIANNILAQIAYQQGEYDAAQRHCETSLAIERRIGNLWSVGFSLTNLGRVAYALHNFQQAEDYYHESLAIRQALQDKRGQALCLRYLGDTAQAQKDFERARRNYDTSLQLFRDIGSQDETSAALYNLGRLAVEQRDHAAALRCFVEALQVARQTASIPRILEAIAAIAGLLAASEPQTAAKLATIVVNHPAANRVSRQDASSLLAAFQESASFESDTSLDDKMGSDLDKLSAELLARFDNAEHQDFDLIPLAKGQSG